MVITVEVAMEIPETAVMETQEDIPADMEVIRVVLWQEVLRLETPDRLDTTEKVVVKSYI